MERGSRPLFTLKRDMLRRGSRRRRRVEVLRGGSTACAACLVVMSYARPCALRDAIIIPAMCIVVTSFILQSDPADTADEVDFEMVGLEPNVVQSNLFVNGRKRCRVCMYATYLANVLTK